MTYQELNKELGNIDIYLLNQILKGRFTDGMKILDAGCGEGRNLIYFIRNNFEAFGVDQNSSAIQMLKMTAKTLNKDYDTGNFSIGDVEDMHYHNNFFDLVISSAVLHYANHDDHFDQMFHELTRVIKKDGILFARMASDIGIEKRIKALGHGRYHLPDGSERYLLTRKKFHYLLEKFSYEVIEPIKTVNVDDKRAMSNLVLRKK